MPPQVHLLGRVADAKLFVNSCAVIPLVSRSGTGVQLKSIETFEAGLPSVATERSLRGINTVPSNCVIANDPRAFADALVQSASKRRAGVISDADGPSFHRQQLFEQDRAVLLALEAFQSGLASAQGRAA